MGKRVETALLFLDRVSSFGPLCSLRVTHRLPTYFPLLSRSREPAVPSLALFARGSTEWQNDQCRAAELGSRSRGPSHSASLRTRLSQITAVKAYLHIQLDAKE